MPMNDVQANAAALVSAQNPQADRIVPSCDNAADYLRTLTISNPDSYAFHFPPTKTTLRLYSQPDRFGTLWFDENGCFQFEGDASASAQVLFDEMKRLSGK